MKRYAIVIALLLAAGPAGAQLYKWVDKDGKVRYGDTPPPGAKTNTIRAPEPAPTPAPAAKGSNTSRGPQTTAEREMEFRKRQAEARKADEKAAKEQDARARKEENCARAKEALTAIESGQRMARTRPNGERYFLSDEQLQEEKDKARAAVRESCQP